MLGINVKWFWKYSRALNFLINELVKSYQNQVYFFK